MDQQEREAFWRGHVDACSREPGLQRDYCRRHGLVARELRKWRTRFYGPVRQTAVGTPAPFGPEPAVSEFAYAAPGDSGAMSASESLAGTVVQRRQWTPEEKRQLVWEGLNSRVSLARFAGRHGIHPSVMHRWLKAFARPVLTASPTDTSHAFATVHIAEPPPMALRQSKATPASSPAPDRDGLIEIELAGGRRVRVGADVDADALRRVIAVLDGPP